MQNANRASELRSRAADRDDADADPDTDSDDAPIEYRENGAKRVAPRRPKKIKLPGGMAIDVPGPDRSAVGQVQPEIAFYVRSYLDVLLGSVVLEKMYLSSSARTLSSEFAVPTAVHNILKYNNIMFSKVTMSVTKIAIPEPVWYDIDVADNRLHLYMNQAMYDDACRRSAEHAVVMADGVIPLENYDPIETVPGSHIDPAVVKCAVICDHVAQHIISDVLGPRKPDGAHIHDNYTNVGTTLHSMLDVVELGTQTRNHRESVNHVTIFRPPSSVRAADMSIDELLGRAGNSNSFSYGA